MKKRTPKKKKKKILDRQGVYKEAKVYPKLHKSKKSKTEGMTRPLNAVLHLNKDRRKCLFNSMIECSSPSKIQLKTSKPTSKQLNHLFRDSYPLDFLGYCTNRFP